MKAKHAEKRHTITISLWLFIAIIAFLVLLIVGITIYSVQRDLNANNSNKTDLSASQTTEQSSQATSENKAIEKTTTASQQKEESSVQPTTEAIMVSGAENADKDMNFAAELYPYKAYDNIGNRDASLKEVFGSIYGGEGFTFDDNGLFCDNITQSEYRYGAYFVADGAIYMTYSNDKNLTAQIIEYSDNVPGEIMIEYSGYDVYFKSGSVE